ncbi:MAG: hypothetical protein HYU66_05410, partial [Armatimonadetes bacterium]|nr:hypothetical protein [Armatimonadota bacterium]
LEGAGTKTAKIKFTGVVDANNSCHGATVAILRAVAEAYPEYVRADFVDGNSEAGQEVKAKAGVNCQCGVILNGKAAIQYDENGKHEEVTFHGPLEWADPASFSKMLHHYLAAEYPGIPKATLDGVAATIKKTWGGNPGHGAGAGGAP